MSGAAKGGSYLLRFEFVPLVGLLAYVGAVRAVEAIFDVGLQPVGPLAGLVLALVPALLWLGYFYALDRRQPEPTHYVFSVFLLGALVAAPVSRWILDGLLEMERWATLSVFSTPNIALAFLAVGAAQETCKYLVVRYTVYLADAFDERADGIVYATAAGLGFAVAVNQGYVAAGVFLTRGALEVTVTTLAHACFAGATGYALGQARFAPKRRGQLIQAAGLLGAILLNGLFYLLHGWVTRPDLELRPWRGLLLSALFAAAVFGGVHLLMRRSLQQDSAAEGGPARPTGPLAGGLLGVLRRADLAVLALAAVLLLAGGLVKARTLDRTLRYQDRAGLGLGYPAGWLPLPGVGEQRVLADVMARDPFKPIVVIDRQPLPQGAQPDRLEGVLRRQLAQERTLFHLLGSRRTRVGRHPAVRLDYACSVDPAARLGSGDIPVTVRGSLLAWADRGVLCRVSVEQSADQHRADPGLADRVLGSVRVER